MVSQTITKAGVVASGSNPGSSQVNKVVAMTPEMNLKTTIDYETAANNVLDMSIFGAAKKCDATKWINPNGCFGMADPWGLTDITDFKTIDSTNKVYGHVRAWKWLADDKADMSKVWSIKNGQKASVLLFEFIDSVPDSTGSAWTAPKVNLFTTVIQVNAAARLTACLITASYLLMF